MSLARQETSAKSYSRLKVHSSPSLLDFPVASKGKRFFAFVIDVMVTTPLGVIVSYVFGKVGIDFFDYIGVFLLTFFYFAYPTYINGQTFGKKILNIKVISGKNNLGQNTLVRTLLREFVGKYVGFFFFGLGYIWIYFDKDHRAWHDLLSTTKVIDLE